MHFRLLIILIGIFVLLRKRNCNMSKIADAIEMGIVSIVTDNLEKDEIITLSNQFRSLFRSLPSTKYNYSYALYSDQVRCIFTANLDSLCIKLSQMKPNPNKQAYLTLDIKNGIRLFYRYNFQKVAVLFANDKFIDTNMTEIRQLLAAENIKPIVIALMSKNNIKLRILKEISSCTIVTINNSNFLNEFIKAMQDDTDCSVSPKENYALKIHDDLSKSAYEKSYENKNKNLIHLPASKVQIVIGVYSNGGQAMDDSLCIIKSNILNLLNALVEVYDRSCLLIGLHISNIKISPMNNFEYLRRELGKVDKIEENYNSYLEFYDDSTKIFDLKLQNYKNYLIIVNETSINRKYWEISEYMNTLEELIMV
jgi:hypothetical protein